MLFRKRIQKSCAYCAHAVKLDDDQVLCMKRGVVAIDRKCRKFEYDPLKRIPTKQKALDFEKYENEDFSL